MSRSSGHLSLKIVWEVCPCWTCKAMGSCESLSSYFPIHSRRIYGILWSLCGLSDSKAKAFSYNKRTMDRAMGPFSPLLALPRINNLRAVNIVIRSTPAASTMSFSINYLQTRRFFKKLHSQSIVIFRTWVPPVDYTSRESLSRHYFLVCNDVLQHLHPLRPEDRENRVTPTSKTLAQQQHGRRSGRFQGPAGRSIPAFLCH
jgi:hypothetical protein